MRLCAHLQNSQCLTGLPLQLVTVQDLAGLKEQLFAAESATATAVRESAQLRQQLRSTQSKGQNSITTTNNAELSRQTSSVVDQVMKETYEALKDEFQSDVTYKVFVPAASTSYSLLSLFTVLRWPHTSHSKRGHRTSPCKTVLLLPAY